MVRSMFGQHGNFGGSKFNVRLTSREVIALLKECVIRGVTPESVVRKIAKLDENTPLPDGLFTAVQELVSRQGPKLDRELPEAPPGSREERGAFYDAWFREHGADSMIAMHPKLIAYMPDTAQKCSEGGAAPKR